MKNELDSSFFIPAFCVGDAKKPLSQKKNRLREFFFAHLRNRVAQKRGIE